MELLNKLVNAFGPCGDEDEVLDVIIKNVEKNADEIYKDTLNNLIVHKKGPGKTIMFTAHTDQIGIVITYIDEMGFLRFGTIGGTNKVSLVYNKVKFKNNIVGIVGYEEKIKDFKDVKISNMYIDIGAKNKEEAEKMVNIGDTAIIYPQFFELGDKIFSGALDDRAGVFALINAINKIKDVKNNLYFVFTSQEEVGFRGAKTAAFDIEPDYAISVDVTDTGDTPDCNLMDIFLGKGAAIKIKDSSIIVNQEIKQMLINCAKENDINYQLEVLNSGGTDAGAIHLTKSGIKTGAISIPTRYIHTATEVIHKSDLDAVLNLIIKFCEMDF